MQCPHCHVPLAITERQGVEVDYCPQCRGVWLDRGELDKIIERAGREFNAPPAPQPYAQPQPQPQPYHAAPRGGQWDQGHHRQKKRKSFLEDVFDF